jgi:hypothetical protein
MLIDFEQSTLAYMTAALEGVCKRIPPEYDTTDLRKRIADEMIASARANRRAYVDFETAGMTALNKVLKSRKRWFSWV